MGLFSDDPKVSKNEMKEVLSRLSQKGFDEKERANVEKIFHGEFDNSKHGVTKKDLDSSMKWLRQNKGKHNLSDSELKTLEEEMKRKI